jgi:group I intron endonuclease
MIGVYKITSPSDKVYIGQSANIEYRWECYRKGYSKKQAKLHASFKKYGVSAHLFEIVHELPVDIDQLALDNYEQIYMDAYMDCGVELLNLREAGCTGRHSEESKEKMKGKLGKWMIGRKLSAETIAKRTAKQKGMKRSKESVKRYSESKKGANNPNFGKPSWNAGLKGFLAGIPKGRKAGKNQLKLF